MICYTIISPELRQKLHELKQRTSVVFVDIIGPMLKGVGEIADTAPTMQRLIQGDVGSGKTVVAAMALAKMVENGYQGALMAPTEILATQHYEEFSSLFSGLPVQPALLTGRTAAAERHDILQGLQDGTIDIVIGTHGTGQQGPLFPGRC